MAESEVTALKENIRTQYNTIQKLYAELEQEREASATATNEALSMILRLQVEKSAEKMEACQYKRMAEEKMRHTDESLEIFEELLHQKEMEIAFLNFQIQSYWESLSSSGISYPNREHKMSGNPSLSRANAFLNTSFHGVVRRNISLPAIKFMESCAEMDNTDTGPSPTTEQSILRRTDDCTNEMNGNCHEENTGGAHQKLSNLIEEPAIGNCNSYCEQVEKRNKNLKELSHTRNVKENILSKCILSTNELQMTMPTDRACLGEGSRSCSWYSAMSHGTSNDSTIGMMGTDLNLERASSSCSQDENMENFLDFDAFSGSYLEYESNINAVHPGSVHDIYEVPQNHNDYFSSEPLKKISLNPIFDDKDMLEKPDSMHNEDMNYVLKDDDRLRKALLYAQHWNKFSTPTKGVTENYYWTLVDPKIVIALPQTDVEQFKKQLQVVEYEKRIMRQQDFNSAKEQLKLLREISEQLNMIQSHIRNPNPRKCPPQDESSFVSLMEAMMSFSI